MKAILFVLAGLGATLGAPASGQTSTAPAPEPGVTVCTTILHLAPGRAGPGPAVAPVRVRARYRAIPLQRRTLEVIRTTARARAFFNGRVLRRLVRLSTDVPLKIGPTTLVPDTYDAGFRCQGAGQWRFVVVDRAGKTLVAAPLKISAAEAEIPVLNLSLMPSGTRGRFLLAARYGRLRGSLAIAWTRPGSKPRS